MNAQANEKAFHLIPRALEGGATVQAAVSQGVDFDGAANGVAIADNPTDALARGIVYHRGPHAQYNAYITRKFFNFDDQRRPFPKISQRERSLRSRLPGFFYIDGMRRSCSLTAEMTARRGRVLSTWHEIEAWLPLAEEEGCVNKFPV
ncbi:hypothetical protein KDW_31450 [Dictyobacter vulcani]|uniref:Uncharacterized protein n=1 Tax=Dictyobacter vulcani TaxID=2607529 RepID=A0A5J4KML4_9CHLR|nr:AHH domain-containing protein [Dictyobacter vulcani]GER88983.1 hypothetical protein KDW_31450 [Dictyobacter vulcani]